MTTFKQFLSTDVIVTPFEVNKGFRFFGNALTGSNVGIDRFEGINEEGLFLPSSAATTGYLGVEYKKQVYELAKQLYYSNYLSSSYGDQPSLRQLVPGVDEAGDRYIGSGYSGGRFYNYLNTTLRYERFFPTASNSSVGVISVPVKLYGERIQPESFQFEVSGSLIYDDGEGNLLSGSMIVGSITYQHGLAIITTGSVKGQNLTSESVTNTNVTCSFSSSYTIYETQYKCTINQNEFKFTQNPSAISESIQGTLYNYLTGSYFSPYVTTVGLYNENQDLLAVGKLSQPLPLNAVTDTNIIINMDR